ncbi:MAG: hypothetical protein ABID67_00755 [Candidatus Nealsonbacteria bacterium]
MSSKDARNSSICRANLAHRRLIGAGKFLEAFDTKTVQFIANGLPSPSYFASDGSRVWVITDDPNNRK